MPPTEWAEGTPVQVDMKGTSGNPPKEGVAKVWDFADNKSTNVLWKVPVPGWGAGGFCMKGMWAGLKANVALSLAGDWVEKVDYAGEPVKLVIQP